MSVPAKPKPPGLWRALAREACLNPEEAAARAAVVAEHERLAAESTPPSTPPSTPRERIAQFEPMLRRTGWQVRFHATDDRARIEASHVDGSAVMVTVGRGRRKYFLLERAGTGTPYWLSVNLSVLEHFAEHRQLPPEGAAVRRPTPKCQCGKSGMYPTEQYAKDAIVEVTVRRVLHEKGRQSERRVYRCPDDDRVWHITSRARWYPSKPKATKDASWARRDGAQR